MQANDQTLTGALEKIAEKFGSRLLVPEAAHTDPREELIIRYTIGSGKFVLVRGSPKIVVTGKIYKLNGDEDGKWEGIDEPVAPIPETFVPPPEPQPPFDKPAPVVDTVEVLSYAKGRFTFGDGSSITAIGPANIRVIYYVDGAAQLWITGDQIITNGTGAFADARGLKTVGGSTWVTAEKAADLTAAGEFQAKTIEVFRVIRGKDIKRP